MMPSTLAPANQFKKDVKVDDEMQEMLLDQTMEQRTIWIWKPAEIEALPSPELHRCHIHPDDTQPGCPSAPSP